MCTIRQLLAGSLFGSSIFYALIVGLLSYQYQQLCLGDWGMRSPALQYKTGKGMCSLIFELKTVLRKEPLLKWEATYSGGWKQGKKDGNGVYTSLSGNRHDGAWKENERHGEGVFHLSDGTEYRGNWKSDSFSGEHNSMILRVSSRLKYPDAASFLNETSYVGNVREGLMHGKGALYFGGLQKRSIHGVFKNGHFIGKGSITLGSGAIILIEDYERPLDNGKLRSKAIMTSDSFGNPVKFEWNGFEIKVIEEGITVSMSQELKYNSNDTQSKESHIQLACYELYDILNTLQWVEFHFLFTKQYLSADIYTFEYVDPDPKGSTEL